VLDLAGNKINKRGQFDIERYSLDVVYANLTTVKRPDVQSDAAVLPFADGCFDVVVCSELLEHVQDPPRVLREVYRVLRKDGILLICVPFLYQIHGDPYDFGRYTDYYWQDHLDKIGFKRIDIEKQGLFWSVLVDMIRAWWYELDISGKLSFKKTALRLMARFKRLAVKWDAKPEMRTHPFFSSYTTGFGIRAQKR
jgi:ubiquinone/menaquinone biosynthesis C-methylase UbiE